MSAARARRALQAAFRHAGRQLAGLARGLPDWLDAGAVHAIALPLDPARWEFSLAVADGIPLAALPARWQLAPGLPPLRLRRLRAAPARAQNAIGLERLAVPTGTGTATCLVRDRLAPNRNYLLSAGHVLAPDARARWDDRFALSFGDRALDLAGKLREWQPAVGLDAAELPRSPIDAGLIEIDALVLAELRELLAARPDALPTGIDDQLAPDRAVSLRRTDGPLAGALRINWSGKVSIPDGDDYPDYFLLDAVGYATRAPTRPGDSGGAVWTADDALLGMHIGEIDPLASQGANAVFGRIAPVLDWYSVKPYLRNDPATLTEADRPRLAQRSATPPASAFAPEPTPARPDAAFRAREIEIVAKTLWGEARGESQAGMEAVACVIDNRKRSGYRGRTTHSAVCLDPKQFSCWNLDDPNRRKLEALDARPDDDYRRARAIAERLLDGGIADPTRGARHYVTRAARELTYWARGKSPSAVIGNHAFFNDIA
ncbi:cell wall hydrolase [Derxia lacustris]|uniref:cell wall hydrolase n=1 Tax=Derxia lacustris TaxID=764842 RepID=UPI001C38AAE9|nr:cell wall hydrolase [Derxia lacustris]